MFEHSSHDGRSSPGHIAFKGEGIIPSDSLSDTVSNLVNPQEAETSGGRGGKLPFFTPKTWVVLAALLGMEVGIPIGYRLRGWEKKINGRLTGKEEEGRKLPLSQKAISF